MNKADVIARCGAAMVATRDHAAMAALISTGRVRPTDTLVGNGTVLTVLGVAAGNAFLDEINNNILYRYVKPLVNDGRLQIAAALVQGTIRSMVPAIITQVQADALCALGSVANPVTAFDVAVALEGE